MNTQRDIAGTQNRPVRYNSSAPVTQQVIDSRRSIDQLWQKLTNIEQTIDKILSVVDFSFTMSQLGNLINKKNGHTVSMPDNGGVCTDHDSRYVRKSQIVPSVYLQATTPGTEQTGNCKISGKGIFGSLLLSSPTYLDLQFPVASGKVPAANFPTWETFTANTNEYSFAVNDYIDCQANEVFHSWIEGSTVDFHLHITTKAANTSGSNRFAKFILYVAYCNKEGVWQETSFTAELTIATGTAALSLKYLDMGDLVLTGYTIGSEIKCRIKRIAATGGTEYSGNIFVTQCGAHLQNDAIGSSQESLK